MKILRREEILDFNYTSGLLLTPYPIDRGGGLRDGAWAAIWALIFYGGTVVFGRGFVQYPGERLLPFAVSRDSCFNGDGWKATTWVRAGIVISYLMPHISYLADRQRVSQKASTNRARSRRLDISGHSPSDPCCFTSIYFINPLLLPS